MNIMELKHRLRYNIFHCLGYDLIKSKKEVDRIYKLSQLESIEWHEKKKWEIAKYHFTNNKHYKSIIGAKLPTNWNDIPLMYKQDYLDSTSNVISKPFRKNNLYYANTSGSNGVPFSFYKNKACHSRTWAHAINCYDSSGITFCSKEARFFGMPNNYKARIIEKIKDIIFNRNRLIVFDLSEKKLEQFVETFRTSNFDYIYGYTNSIVYFSKYLIRKGIVLKEICPTLSQVIITAEMCSPEDRKIIKNAIGVNVINEYGSSEFGIIAYECPNGIMHLNESTLYIEQNDNNQIIITDLFNLAFPFIRYVIGDLGIISDNDCDCRNRSRKIMTKLIGRENDMIYLPSGKTSPGLTFYYLLRYALEKKVSFSEILIRQERVDTFHIEILAEKEFTKIEEKIITKAFDFYLEKNLKIIIKYVHSINVNSNFKNKYFYSEL